LIVRWLITGSRGQLGSDLQVALAEDPTAVVLATDRRDLDITNSIAVDALIADFIPDLIVNAAAYTAVDRAESDEETAYLVNGAGPALLAAAIGRHGGRLIHVSTDYVFAGDASSPYGVDHLTAPKSAYGRTKLAGEHSVRELLPQHGYVVRTAWVYGAVGANFVKTMARLERELDTVSVVNDQRGSPTWSGDLARALIELGNSDAPVGIYHCTNGGDTTWYGFTRAIFEELGADPARILPTTTDAFPRPAPRPAYSVLSDEAWLGAGLCPMRNWRDALGAAFASHGDALRSEADHSESAAR
jgi:dTDP-4-dehydrorhamnose reductase